MHYDCGRIKQLSTRGLSLKIKVEPIRAQYLPILVFVDIDTTSYPESSGFLVSGWAPEETLGNSKKKIIF